MATLVCNNSSGVFVCQSCGYVAPNSNDASRHSLGNCEEIMDAHRKSYPKEADKYLERKRAVEILVRDARHYHKSHIFYLSNVRYFQHALAKAKTKTGIERIISSIQSENNMAIRMKSRTVGLMNAAFKVKGITRARSI